MRDQVSRWLPVPHRFVALVSENVHGVSCIPLQHEWPGWWSKLELFSLLEPPVFYMDLDIVLTGDITHLVTYPHIFTTSNFVSPGPKGVNSSVMAWDTDLSELYRRFLESPERAFADHVTSNNWVDQGFIQTYHPPHMFFNDMWPGEVVSFKRDLRKLDPTGKTKIVVFHGRPKPQEVVRPWIPTMECSKRAGEPVC